MESRQGKRSDVVASLERPGANRSGFALLPILLSLALIGVLVGFGLDLIGPKVKQAKYAQTGDAMHSASQVLISWASVNGRLPDYTEFPAVVKQTADAWEKPLVYVYDDDLTRASTGGICGRTATQITSGAQPDIAFLLISGGDDLTVDTATPANGSVFTPTTVNFDAGDIGELMALAELKNRAGCYGDTAGRLRILNNELPDAIGPKAPLPGDPGSGCSGLSYDAAIFAEGGVPAATSPYYNWSQTAPGWITGFNAVEDRLDIQGTPAAPGSYALTVTVTDTEGNSARRSYAVEVTECTPAP